jgi:hypothetical protein
MPDSAPLGLFSAEAGRSTAAPFSARGGPPPLRSGQRSLMTPNTSSTLEVPASLRTLRWCSNRLGMPFGFPSDRAFSFSGTLLNRRRAVEARDPDGRTRAAHSIVRRPESSWPDSSDHT